MAQVAAPEVPAAVAGLAEKISVKVGGDMSVVLIVLAVVGAFFAAYLLYFVLKKQISASYTYTFPETMMPISGLAKTKLKGDNVSDMTNGKRISVAFWIYVSDIGVNQGVARNVLCRGNPDSLEVQPIVKLHPNENKISFIFAPEARSDKMKADLTTMAANNATETDRLMFDAATYGITIDNIPSRRWVHVAVVVSDDVAGGYVNAYLDGELVKTVNRKTDMKKIATVKPMFDIENIDVSISGDIHVGPTKGDPGFSGYISKVSVTNSDLNPVDVYNMYLDGPITDNLLTKAGYGVRSPIYRQG